MNRKEIEGTPVFEEYLESNVNCLNSILRQQIFLQDNGVSFEYSDNLLFFERNRLVEAYNVWNEEKNKKLKQQ